MTPPAWLNGNRWRDGKGGLVHQLEPIWGATSTFTVEIVRWRPLCGYARRSDKPSNYHGPITCFGCIQGARRHQA